MADRFAGMSNTPLMPDLDTDVIVEERTVPVTNDGGDHERFAHYVKKSQILSSAIEGTQSEALCGKKWTPTRDPERYPICPECKEIYEALFS